MKKRATLPVLVSACSLLLAPAAVAQQEVIDPQPEPGAESPPPPSSPTAPEPAAPPREAAPGTPEPPAQPTIPLATSKPAQQDTLLSSTTIVGTTVKNPQGEELGRIQDLMIDPQNGRVVQALVAFGGMLGLNEKHVAIPWEAFKVGLGQEELIVEMEKEQLQRAPAAGTN
jgi:sporulation protein YlmC with PRC-barrel domain